MIVVLGSSFDEEPFRLAQIWSSHESAVVTPAHLSRPGWRLRLGRPGDAQAVIGDRAVRADELDAVVNLLPWITVHELPHIVEEDREYVASEMGAFLLAWLCQLECPVLDRPSGMSLAGCGRWPHEWRALAKRLNMAVNPSWPGSTFEITVVAGRAFSTEASVTTRQLEGAETLARMANRSLVTMRFSAADSALVEVASRPSVATPAVANAILGCLGAQ
jgi:hypothetical protein